MDRPRPKRPPFDWSSIRHWDLFPKFDADVVVQSKAGGCVTMIALTCVFILLLSETYYFFGEQRMDTIVVDDSLSIPFPIYFDIIFPFLECSITVVDVVDDEEHPIPVLYHDIVKHRINIQGEDLATAQARTAKQNAQAGGAGAAPSVQTVKELGKGYGAVQEDCMPCAEGFFFSGERCCDCKSVREYYRRLGEDESYTTHPLCIREHSQALKATLQGAAGLSLSEGCRVTGTITVPRVRANLHVAAAFNQLKMQSRGGLSSLDDLNSKFKVQHVIKELRFGEAFDGQANPLTGVELYNPGLLRHIYLIKLVPTRYEGSWIPIQSYQYSFAPHTEKVDTSKAHWHFPGVYFRYDFTPMMALISTRYSHLSTSVD